MGVEPLKSSLPRPGFLYMIFDGLGFKSQDDQVSCFIYVL